MPLGRSYDARIIDALARGPLSTTKLAKELQVADGPLTVRLFQLVHLGVIRICGAVGRTPIWELTEAGRERRHRG